MIKSEKFEPSLSLNAHQEFPDKKVLSNEAIHNKKPGNNRRCRLSEPTLAAAIYRRKTPGINWQPYLQNSRDSL